MLLLLWIVSFTLEIIWSQEIKTGTGNCTLFQKDVNYIPKQISYAVNNRVNFLCNSGSLLIGDSSLTCKEGGKWDKEFPFCCQLMQTFESVSQTSIHMNNSADLAVDGLPNTTSSTEYEEHPHWTAKLPNVSEILAVKLKSPGNVNISVTVRSFMNDSTTCGIIPRTDIPETDKEKIVHCPANTSGGDIMLQINEKGKHQLQLTEVHVCAMQIPSVDKANDFPVKNSFPHGNNSHLQIKEPNAQASPVLYVSIAAVAGVLMLIGICFAATRIRMRKRKKRNTSVKQKTDEPKTGEIVRNPSEQVFPNESEYSQIIYDQIPQEGDSPRPRLPSSPRPTQIESPLLAEISRNAPCLQHEYCQPSDKSDVSCQLYCKCNLRENDPHHVYVEPNDLIINSENVSYTGEQMIS